MHWANTTNFNLKNDDFFFFFVFLGEVQSSNPLTIFFTPWMGAHLTLTWFGVSIGSFFKKIMLLLLWMGRWVGSNWNYSVFLTTQFGAGVCNISCSGSTINLNISHFFFSKTLKILSPYYSVENFRKST